MSLCLGAIVNIRSPVWFCFLLCFKSRWKSLRTREISLYMVFYFENSPVCLSYYSAKLPPLISSASRWTIGLGIFTDSESQAAFLSLPKSVAYSVSRGKLPRGSVYKAYPVGIRKKLRRSKTKQETWEPKITKIKQEMKGQQSIQNFRIKQRLLYASFVLEKLFLIILTTLKK